MKATIEHLTSILRVHKSSDAKYGDPYETVATIRWLNPDEVEVVGLCGPMDRMTRDSIVECLAESGAKVAHFKRYKNSAELQFKRKLTRELKNG